MWSGSREVWVSERVWSRLLGQPGNDGDSLTMFFLSPLPWPEPGPDPPTSSWLKASSTKETLSCRMWRSGSRSPFGAWIFSTARSKMNETIWMMRSHCYEIMRSLSHLSLRSLAKPPGAGPKAFRKSGLGVEMAQGGSQGALGGAAGK